VLPLFTSERGRSRRQTATKYRLKSADLASDARGLCPCVPVCPSHDTRPHTPQRLMSPCASQTRHRVPLCEPPCTYAAAEARARAWILTCITIWGLVMSQDPPPRHLEGSRPRLEGGLTLTCGRDASPPFTYPLPPRRGRRRLVAAAVKWQAGGSGSNSWGSGFADQRSTPS
jgi:hypothetical protein